MQTAIRNILLAFVLISVGFALGKHSAKRSAQAQAADDPHEAPLAGETGASAERVRVYYLHTTFRCVTCNTIEKMTRELLESQFAEELADGRIEWHEADFQEQEPLAEAFDVVASCVVVARVRGDEVLGYRRLDEVWTLMKEPAEFDAVVGDAIRSALAAAAQARAGGGES
jgi:hypothetical protein